MLHKFSMYFIYVWVRKFEKFFTEKEINEKFLD